MWTQTRRDRIDAALEGAAILAALAGLALSGGCMDTSPAARSNRAQYGDITVRIEGRGNRVRLTIGDGLYASADAADVSGETQTATPSLSVPTTVTLPAAADPLAAGIQAASDVAREGIKAAAKAGGGARGAADGGGCVGGQCELRAP